MELLPLWSQLGCVETQELLEPQDFQDGNINLNPNLTLTTRKTNLLGLDRLC